MNYRHAFHAGNHADVLKHAALLALCEALVRKPAPCFALDTHAGRGLYLLDDSAARRTGEALEGVERVLQAPARPALAPYRAAIAACRARHGDTAYPGSPWLLAHALRMQDRIACCELQPDEAAALKANQDHLSGVTPLFEAEFRMRHKDGRWIWVLDRGKVIAQGTPDEVRANAQVQAVYLGEDG